MSIRPDPNMTPALLCDRCQWPMSVAEIVLNPDGTIPGMPQCGQCRADIAEDLLAARQMELQP